MSRLCGESESLQGILSVCEIMDTRTGVAFGPRGARSAIRRFRVITDVGDFGQNEICSAIGIPRPWEGYIAGNTLDITIVAAKISASLDPQSQDDNRKIWIVTVEYTDDVPDEGLPAAGFGNTAGSQTTPWLEPPMIRYDSEVIQRSEPNDLLGSPYTNSANQPFTPPFTIERARRILVLTRNQANFNFDTVDGYSFAYNSDNFTPPGAVNDIAPGGCQCFPIQAEHAQRGAVGFWRVSYRIRIGAMIGVVGTGTSLERESFMNVRVLDAGMMQLQKDPSRPDTGSAVPIFRSWGRISQPVLLDGTGTASNTNVPKYRTFRPYQGRPFTPILTIGVG